MEKPGNRLRRIRKEAGLSIKELCYYMNHRGCSDVTEKRIRKWEAEGTERYSSYTGKPMTNEEQRIFALITNASSTYLVYGIGAPIVSQALAWSDQQALQLLLNEDATELLNDFHSLPPELAEIVMAHWRVFVQGVARKERANRELALDRLKGKLTAGDQDT